MLEIDQSIINLLTTDPTLNAIVPATSIFTGPVDQTMESQASLTYPIIVLSQVSEVSRSVPLSTRDTNVQIDIWSRNSQLEIETIYERIIELLNYQSGNQGTAHLFWQRLGGAVDLFESDRRVWHRSSSYTIWSIKS
jgi:hypothetical protein